MSVNWETVDYTAAELAHKIDNAGGLAPFIVYYLNMESLPTELKPVAKELKKAYEICRQVFESAGAMP